MKLNTDRVLAVTAMVVGVASLVVVVYQTQLERRAQSASVLPYLTMSMTLNEAECFFMLRNVGLGPALIDDVRVVHKGKAVPGDAVDFYQKMQGGQPVLFDVDQIKVGRLIPAGEWIRMLGTTNASSRESLARDILRLFQIAEVPRSWYTALRDQAHVVTEDAILEVTYSSVFGQRWVARSDSLVPTASP